jgi:hypothetical protein
LGAGLTIQTSKTLLLRNPNWGGQGPNWAVEPYDDDDDDPVAVHRTNKSKELTIIRD